MFKLSVFVIPEDGHHFCVIKAILKLHKYLVVHTHQSKRFPHRRKSEFLSTAEN